MEICPYCSTRLLRHVRDAQIYWFCRHCWWELPFAITDRTLSPHVCYKPNQASSNLAAFYTGYSESNTSNDRSSSSSLL